MSYTMMKTFVTSHLKRVLFLGTDGISSPRRTLTLCSSASRMTILELLGLISARSTDSRDRIYGMRGTCPKYYKDTMNVDYTIDFPTLCRRFMSNNMKKEKNLDILGYFNPFSSAPGTNYPSWLCDLRHRTSGITPYTYSCSLNHKSFAKITGKTLRAKGIRLGAIKGNTRPFQMPDSNNLAIHNRGTHLLELENLALENLRLCYPDEDRETLEGKFMNMVAGNRQHETEWTKITTSSWQLWNRISGKLPFVIGELNDDEEEKFRMVFERIDGRCFFTASNNLCGIGPPDLRSDDDLCILYGCSLWVVLRKAGSGYLFVGPAYVDGATSGEYVGELRKVGREKQRENMFSIL